MPELESSPEHLFTWTIDAVRFDSLGRLMKRSAKTRINSGLWYTPSLRHTEEIAAELMAEYAARQPFREWFVRVTPHF